MRRLDGSHYRYLKEIITGCDETGGFWWLQVWFQCMTISARPIQPTRNIPRSRHSKTSHTHRVEVSPWIFTLEGKQNFQKLQENVLSYISLFELCGYQTPKQATFLRISSSHNLLGMISFWDLNILIWGLNFSKWNTVFYNDASLEMESCLNWACGWSVIT